MSEVDPFEWREYIVRARINPQKNQSRVQPLSTEPERVKEYLTGNNCWTNIVEVEVAEFPMDQEVLL